MTNKSVSRNEIEELKELEKKDGKNSYAGVINPDTLFVALKQVAETLNLDNKKFMQLTPNPPLKDIVMK
jgi:hypothetical protein